MERTNASLAELAVRVRHPVFGEKKPRDPSGCMFDAMIAASFLVSVCCAMKSMSSELRNAEIIFATGVGRLELILSHLISNFTVFFLQELFISGPFLASIFPIRGSLIAYFTLRILNGVQASTLGVAIAFGHKLWQRSTLKSSLFGNLGICLVSLVIQGEWKFTSLIESFEWAAKRHRLPCLEFTILKSQDSSYHSAWFRLSAIFFCPLLQPLP